ncbi:MAG: peptidoglycan synthetase [Saprospiraceae bacterium]|nr:peptidoglycan synthetase [Saprospiraceae bacterium]
MSRIHLIAVGGSVMHNLALALSKQGHQISGSDDQIYEPAKSRLAAAGILPEIEGWDANRIDQKLDLVILGMHAKNDNPELLKALELGIRIQSFPEFVGEQFSNKTQIVVTGSHGKTTTTSMLMHVFQKLGISFDYLVGAQLDGFDTMVSFTNAPYAIIEGDEYLSSCLDARSKFMHYHPTINIITGVAWDHYNVFPTFQSYLNTFQNLVASLDVGSHVIYYEKDPLLNEIILHHADHLMSHPYTEANSQLIDGIVYLNIKDKTFPLKIFGKHNMQNLQAVLNTCSILNIPLNPVAEALSSFTGAAKRMELISENSNQVRYKDFAHAPSKVKATIEAVRERYPDKRILVILELHTYSSLNKEFLPQYKNTVDLADQVVVYFDQKALEIKRMNLLDPAFIKSAFGNDSIKVCENKSQLEELLNKYQSEFDLILFLGSGQFGGISLL